MRPAPTPSGRVFALATALALSYWGARRLAPVSWPSAEDLKDSVADISQGDLAHRHAGLVPDVKGGCALCHIPHREDSRPALWASEDSGTALGRAEGPPPDTAVCESCHDAAARVPANGAPGLRGAHPVGADYRQVWMEHPDDYNPPESSPHIRLENGKVGCLSCHKLHGTTGFGVDEEACQACHRR